MYTARNGGRLLISEHEHKMNGTPKYGCCFRSFCYFFLLRSFVKITPLVSCKWIIRFSFLKLAFKLNEKPNLMQFFCRLYQITLYQFSLSAVDRIYDHTKCCFSTLPNGTLWPPRLLLGHSLRMAGNYRDIDIILVWFVYKYHKFNTIIFSTNLESSIYSKN